MCPCLTFPWGGRKWRAPNPLNVGESERFRWARPEETVPAVPPNHGGDEVIDSTPPGGRSQRENETLNRDGSRAASRGSSPGSTNKKDVVCQVLRTES